MDKSVQKLFFITQNKRVITTEETSFAKEKELQTLVEGNLMNLLGLHFVKSEHSLKSMRFDTLGLTRDGYPAIIEYKRNRNKDVLRQIMSYVRVLEDNKTDFQYLLVDKKQEFPKIRWGYIRVICMAEGFEQADVDYIASCKHAVELITYRYFNNDTLLFEWEHGEPPDRPPSLPSPKPSLPKPSPRPQARLVRKHDSSDLDSLVRDFHRAVKRIGPGITYYQTAVYEGYKKNGQAFVTFKIYPKARRIRVWLPLDPRMEKVDGEILRNMTGVGHHGLGNLEISVESKEVLDQHVHLLRKSYEAK